MRTSMYSILCIGIRLSAVLLAVHTLVGIPGAYSMVREGWSTVELWILAILYPGLLLLAFLLWVFPGMLARLAAGKASQQIFESPIESAELQYIVFSVVGLWIFFDALFDLINIGLREAALRHFVRVQNDGMDMSERNAQLIASYISNLIQLGVGFSLVFGAWGLVGLLRRARHGWLPPINVDDPVVERGEKS